MHLIVFFFNYPFKFDRSFGQGGFLFFFSYFGHDLALLWHRNDSMQLDIDGKVKMYIKAQKKGVDLPLE